MHNPRLKHRLHRIKVPTLLIWGEQDGIVTTRYGQAYRDLIPGATMAEYRRRVICRTLSSPRHL